jgi:hypothetical protein
MAEPVAFCPNCGQPTRHATDADRLDHDLKQWRTHVKAAASGGNGKRVSGPPPRTGVATATRQQPFVAPAPETKKRRFAMPALRLPKLRMPRSRANGQQVEINLDTDDPFAYTACVTCGATDWILRGRQNEDGRYPYWCLRCSRSFKTTARLAQARKPFIAAGAVVAVLIFFLFVLR